MSAANQVASNQAEAAALQGVSGQFMGCNDCAGPGEPPALE
jgi:hypothetical protein